MDSDTHTAPFEATADRSAYQTTLSGFSAIPHTSISIPSSSPQSSSSTLAEKMEGLLSTRVHLPDIDSQTDNYEDLQRRLQTYKSYTASTSVMLHVPVTEDTQNSVQPQFHHRYYIKTVATTKCDECQQRCKGRSEVYQCRDCAAQICRECVEENLEKEKVGEAGTAWEWRSFCHVPFKAAFLQRQSDSLHGHGEGEWIGTVKLPEIDTQVSVSLEYPPNNATTIKHRIRRSRVAEHIIRVDRENQRSHVRNQAIESGSRLKLDRILNAASSSVSKPGTKLDASHINQKSVSGLLERSSIDVDCDRAAVNFATNRYAIPSFDGPSDDISPPVITEPSHEQEEEKEDEPEEPEDVEENVSDCSTERTYNGSPPAHFEGAPLHPTEDNSTSSAQFVPQDPVSDAEDSERISSQPLSPDNSTQDLQTTPEQIDRPRSPLPFRLGRPGTPPAPPHLQQARREAPPSPTPIRPPRPRRRRGAAHTSLSTNDFQIHEDSPVQAHLVVPGDPTSTTERPNALHDGRPSSRTIPTVFSERAPLSSDRYHYAGVADDLRARFEGRITTYSSPNPNQPSHQQRELLTYALIAIDVRTNEWLDIPLVRPVRNYRRPTPDPDRTSLFHHRPAPAPQQQHQTMPLPLQPQAQPHQQRQRRIVIREDPIEADTVTEPRLLLPVQGPQETPLSYAVRLVGVLGPMLRGARDRGENVPVVDGVGGEDGGVGVEDGNVRD